MLSLIAVMLPAVAYAQGNAWVITDVHLDNTYTPGTDVATNCQRGNGTAGKFGNILPVDYNDR